MMNEDASEQVTAPEVGQSPVEAAVAEPPAADEFNSGVLLRGSDLLTPDEASKILAPGSGRVIVWAGAKGSGKTTLTAELYERHRRNRALTSFSGSRTLLGLEERIHPSRAASGRVTPHTPRSDFDPEGRELLHFSVRSPHTELIFADFPGEAFRRIRDNEKDPRELPLLYRADKLAFIADGGLIADPNMRASAGSFISQLIDRFKLAGLPAPDTQVILLLTKYDKVIAGGEAALNYWAELEKRLLAKLQRISPLASSMQTAAREGEESGMEELMEWLLNEPAHSEEPNLPDPPRPATPFQRLHRPKVRS
jgi:hypothetical protein